MTIVNNIVNCGFQAGIVSALLLTTGMADAQVPNPIDAAAVESALVPIRKEVSAACGFALDLSLIHISEPTRPY